MRHPKQSTSQRKFREQIAVRVRELRLARRWSQVQLAKRLGLSQSRLSEIESGDGSFTAEQFLEILALFNVTASSFTGPVDRRADLQNALARAGATNLLETERVASEELADVHAAIIDALIDGSSRLITGIGPVVVRNANQVNARRLVAETLQIGLRNRLLWVFDNIIHALQMSSHRRGAHARALLVLRNAISLDGEIYIDGYDVVDPTIRTQAGLEKAKTRSSELSKKWHIVSALQPADFKHALEQADLL